MNVMRLGTESYHGSLIFNNFFTQIDNDILLRRSSSLRQGLPNLGMNSGRRKSSLEEIGISHFTTLMQASNHSNPIKFSLNGSIGLEVKKFPVKSSELKTIFSILGYSTWRTDGPGRPQHQQSRNQPRVLDGAQPVKRSNAHLNSDKHARTSVAVRFAISASSSRDNCLIQPNVGEKVA